MTDPTDRRRFLVGGAGIVGAALLGGCDILPKTAAGRQALQAGEDASLFVQRLLLSAAKLAPEFSDADISKTFKANGTEDPPDRAYKDLARRKFADYRLLVDGLVEHPLKLSVTDLKEIPSRTQTTRHDCVEGWSCIGKWRGVPMQEILKKSGILPKARYVVLHCADTMEGGEAEESDSESDGAQKGGDQKASNAGKRPPAVRYYETIDLEDAYHPQTILAYEMNGSPLPVAHGAPLRLRVERQLGYKMAKYVMRLELVEDFAKLGDGKGGYWEDRGYDWYAGI
jgi:DMSO/TMAO reductase YedYZ molybdopterin-dependent catalytic subunit